MPMIEPPTRYFQHSEKAKMWYQTPEFRKRLVSLIVESALQEQPGPVTGKELEQMWSLAARRADQMIRSLTLLDDGGLFRKLYRRLVGDQRQHEIDWQLDHEGLYHQFYIGLFERE